jgi:hypothetical protein
VGVGSPAAEGLPPTLPPNYPGVGGSAWHEPEVKGLVLVLPVPICEADKVVCVRAEQSVQVQCLRCGHVGLLTAETLSRLAIAPITPHCRFRQTIALPPLWQSKRPGDTQACVPTAKGLLMCGDQPQKCE